MDPNKRYVAHVNQAGKVNSEDEATKVRWKKAHSSPFIDGLMRVLNGFANFVSPIKEQKGRYDGK